MKNIEILFNAERDELFDAIQPFQQEILNEFLTNTSNNYQEAINLWINASPSNTSYFGGAFQKKNLYSEMLMKELEKFFCDEEHYTDEKNKIKESTDRSTKYLIGVLSAAIGKTLGVAGTFIAPIIVLLLMSFGKMAVNAWCEMRKEQSNNSLSKIE